MRFKNVGVWLGELTLARDKPIIRRWLCLRSLIEEAEEFSLVHQVVPIVCKILECIKESKTFGS